MPKYNSSYWHKSGFERHFEKRVCLHVFIIIASMFLSLMITYPLYPESVIIENTMQLLEVSSAMLALMFLWAGLVFMVLGIILLVEYGIYRFWIWKENKEYA